MSGFFQGFIRVVFLFAYAAFLAASVRHIAYFFHNFEQDSNSWIGSYALAIAIDATSLVLAIGVMFFRQGMPLHALIGTWFFILGLTAFSLLVNWEYAIQFQHDGLSKATDFLWINPILASSFAFLNVAYSVVAEFFNSKAESAEDLQKRLDDLRQKAVLKQELSALKNDRLSAWIAGKKNLISEAFSAENVPTTSERNSGELNPEVVAHLPEMLEQENSALDEDLEDTDPQLSVVKPAPQEQKPRKYVMTFEEASEYTGYAISTLKQQVEKGEIQPTLSGKKLRVSTLRIKSGFTNKMPAIKVAK